MATKKAVPVKKKRTPRKVRNFSVVGMHYRCTTPQIREWQEILPLKVKIERDLNNQHDENAMAVYLDDHKKTGQTIMKIGYLPRQVAAVLAPAMDDGSVAFTDATLESLNPELGSGEVQVYFVNRPG